MTAKGGDRSQVIVQWRLLAPFAVILALTLMGLVLALLDDRFAFFDAGDGTVEALGWTLYNVAALAFTILRPATNCPGTVRMSPMPSLSAALREEEAQIPQEVWLLEPARDRVRIRVGEMASRARGRLRIRDVGDVAVLTLSTTADGAHLSLLPDDLVRHARPPGWRLEYCKKNARMV